MQREERKSLQRRHREQAAIEAYVSTPGKITKQVDERAIFATSTATSG
jgi:adenylylsulfate kinase-like enzyme